MVDFMICVPTQIFFGRSALENLADGVKKYGNRVMLVYGGGSIKKNGIYDKVTGILSDNDIFCCELAGVEPNPRVSLLKKGIAIARENKVDAVLAIGGGSAIDTAKGIAGAYYHDGDFWNLAGANILSDKVLPVLTILTLPAAGSEMATGCTWVNDEVTPHIKSSFHGPYIRPRISYLNPEFTFTLSKRQTAAGVTDIMSHIFESYFSNVKGAYLHARTAEGMLKTLFRYAPIALEQPDNYEARANIMYCSSWGNNGLIVKGNYVSWSVHLLENPINEQYDCTHGDGLAVLTPHWMRWALREENRYRYVEFGVNVLGIDSSLSAAEITEKAIAAVEDFFYNTLGMPRRLRDLGVQAEDLANYAKVFQEPICEAYQKEAFVPIDVQGALEIYKSAL